MISDGLPAHLQSHYRTSRSESASSFQGEQTVRSGRRHGENDTTFWAGYAGSADRPSRPAVAYSPSLRSSTS